MTLLLKKRAFFLLIILSFFSQVTFALNFAVDNTGAGSFCVDHSGSGGNFTTLAAAMAAANTGGAPHTIDICPGVGAYTAQAGALTAANYAGLTIQGTTGIAANITVNPSGGNEIFDLRQANITIQHLTAISGNGNDGIEIRGGNNANILNVDIQNTGRDGIIIINSTGVTISNVTITTTASEGIYVNAGSTGLVINSADGTKPSTVITGTGQEGIQVDAANAELDNITVNTTGREGILLNGLAPMLNQNNPANTITISNTTREGIRTTNNADNAIIDNLTISNTTRECAEHQGDGDGVTVNFQNYDLSNCGLEGMFMRSPNQVADTIKVDTTTGNGRECMEVDGNDSIVTNLDLDNCAGAGLRFDGAGVSITTANINTTGTVGSANSHGVRVSGNDGILNNIDILNINNNGIHIENARADLDNITVTGTLNHGVRITAQDADINTLSLTNIGTYLGGNAGADGITTTNRRLNLTNVTINDARDFGIYFNTTGNNHGGIKNFTNITIKDTGDDGIFINRSTNNLTMDTVSITNSSDIGLTLFRTRQSTLSNLTIDGSSNDGISINRSRQNEIFDSTITNSGDIGIALDTSNNNTTEETRNNLIHDNIISNNANYGLRIFNRGTADNDNNQIYENCFNNPAGINARDDENTGGFPSNLFDVGARGNFWDDDSANSPGFSETCADVVLPIGICDTTFPIPNAGNSVDNNPLTSCGVLPPVDHYDIDFSAVTGITCVPVSVTITAKDSSNNTAVHSVDTTIDLGTNTGLGDWVTVTAGTGTLTDATAGDGIGSYEFPAGESSVTITFNYTALATPPTDTVNINITSTPNETSGVATTDTDPGDGTDDPDIDFSLAGFIYNNVTDTNNTIPTQISGKDSDAGSGAVTLNIQAVRTSDDDPTVCQSIFGNGDVVTIQMGAECKNPSNCSGSELNIKNANLPVAGQDIDTSNDDASAQTVASYEDIALVFGANSDATISLNYPDAGSLELHARYELLLDDGTPSGNFATGISNVFVVRPFGFDIDIGTQRFDDFNDDSILNDSTGNNFSWATDATGTAFAKAGNNFNVTVRSVVWDSNDDTSPVDGVPDAGSDLTDNALTPNFGNEAITELVDITHSKVTPTGGTTVSGNLTGGDNLDFTSSGGTLTTALSWDEVGTIDLTATLDASVDSEYLAGGSGMTATHEDFGRFVPDRFAVSDNTPSFQDSCGGTFTYMDQEFYFTTAPQLTVTAVNEAGATTINYGGGTTGINGFWQLDPVTLTRTYTNQVTTAATFNESIIAGVTLSNHTDFDGVGLLTLGNTMGDRDIFEYQRASVDISANEGGVFTALVDLTISSSALSYTEDGITVCYDRDNDNTCDDYTHMTQSGAEAGSAALTGAELRFGLLRIGTASGSELLSLPVLFETQYYDDTVQNFITNTDDGCTAIAASDLEFTSDVTSGSGPTIDITNATSCGGTGDATATMANNPFSVGSGGLSFTVAAPAVGCTGYIDIDLDLSMGGLDMEWLQYDWADELGDGPFNVDPSGRVDFGVFKGPDEFIYIREPW